MKRAELLRGASSDQGTFGVLTIGQQTIYATELPWRDNRRQRSCIPAGKYRCELVRSPRFGLVYEVKNVPGRSNVLIHRANLGGDIERGWDTELQGCIAPALRLGAMRNSEGKMQAAGLLSGPAFREFMEWAEGSPFVLEVKDHV